MVVGGAGFIGSALTNELVRLKKYQVTILDNLSTENKKQINSGVRFYLADVQDNRLIDKIFMKEKPEIVINEAAVVYWSDKGKDPSLDCSTSIVGTTNLLKNCVKHKVNKFIFASSISVYGRGLHKSRVLEETPILPNNIPLEIFSYAWSKYTAEQYVQYFSKTSGLNYSILRYAHVYGPGQIRQEDVISFFIKNLINNKPFSITGNGKQSRDYIYIKDVVEATIATIDSGSSVFNIGGGKPVAVNDLVKIFSKIFNKKIKTRYSSLGLESGGVYMDISKAKKELNWSPRINLETGLKETYSYFKEIKSL